MIRFLRRCRRKFFCSAAQLYSLLCRPLFFFCFLLSFTPGVLLTCLLAWKAMFFPAAMPHLLWLLFLPAWLFFSCSIPSLCASAALAMKAPYSFRCLTVLVPICTMQLLLSFSWSLFLLYHLPPLFCVLSAAICSISGLLCFRYASKLCPPVGSLMLLFGLWNVCLLFLSADF